MRWRLVFTVLNNGVEVGVYSAHLLSSWADLA